MIIFNESDEPQIGRELEVLKCSWEGSHMKNVVVIDIPNDVFYQVLPESRFARIHKRFIISMNSIESYNQSNVIFKNGKEFPIGRTYRDTAANWLINGGV
jgi:hypothetical protein